MAITVAHSPAASVLASAAYSGGLENLRRWNAEQALRQQQLNQQAQEAATAQQARMASIEGSKAQTEAAQTEREAQRKFQAEQAAAGFEQQKELVGMRGDLEAAERERNRTADFEAEQRKNAEIARKEMWAETERGLNPLGVQELNKARRERYLVSGSMELSPEQKAAELAKIDGRLEQIASTPEFAKPRDTTPQEVNARKQEVKVIDGEEVPGEIDEKGMWQPNKAWTDIQNRKAAAAKAEADAKTKEAKHQEDLRADRYKFEWSMKSATGLGGQGPRYTPEQIQEEMQKWDAMHGYKPPPSPYDLPAGVPFQVKAGFVPVNVEGRTLYVPPDHPLAAQATGPAMPAQPHLMAPQPGAPIDKEVAKEFLALAGGDPARAKQMILEHGWR